MFAAAILPAAAALRFGSEPKRPTRRAWQAEALRFRISWNATIPVSGRWRLYALGGQAQPPRHRPDAEPIVEKQRQVHLPAHRGDVGLLDEDRGGLAV
jgi:hypothetical protein